MATDKELSDFLESVERRAFKQAVYAVRKDESALDIVQDAMIKLAEKYGTKLVPPNGPIPAHLLGNMWAQEWGNIYPLVAPATSGPGYDVTKLLEAKKVDQVGMFHIAENFFTSLGLQKLPETFWKRSLMVKPRDREVVCHASAWPMDGKQDVRIKMCTEVTGEDLVTVHHEMGHD